MYTFNLGKLCDLIAVYHAYFESEEILFETIDKGEILEEFSPFFVMHNGEILMEKIMLENVDKLMGNNSDSLIFDALSDCDMLCNQLVAFYFKGLDVVYKEKDFSSLELVSKHIVASDLPYKTKNALLTIFINPRLIVNKLIKSMIHISSQISRIYESSFHKIGELTAAIDDEELKRVLRTCAIETKNENMPIYYTFGFLQPNCVRGWCLESCRLLYLGVGYKNNLKMDGSCDIEMFGKIMSEPVRLKILDCILRSGSVTVSEINHMFGYGGTTSYYHVTMMQKAGMIHAENQKKTIHYTINKKYFCRLTNMLKKYME